MKKVEVVGFFNKVSSSKNGTVTFSIVAVCSGVPTSFTEFIGSVSGVKEVSREYHDIGMGYWIYVTVAKELFKAVVEKIKSHIEKQERMGGLIDYKVDFFKDYSHTDNPDDWPEEWNADILRAREYGLNKGDEKECWRQ